TESPRPDEPAGRRAHGAMSGAVASRGEVPAAARARTILAFDYGARRIGVAVGNTVTGSARPLQTLEEPVAARRFERIGALLGEWQPDALVVGRPLQPDGAANAVTLAAERFARQLTGRFGLPVALVDERYSSVAARERLRETAAQD